MAAKSLRPICVIGKTAFILLTKKQVAVIDAADVPLVEGRSWYAHRGRKTFYAAMRDSSNGRKMTYLHRVLCDGDEIDHRDEDGLNCCRLNLRSATKSQNRSNAGKRIDNTSGYKGVYRARYSWEAKFVYKGAVHRAGFHPTAEAAAAAVAELRVKIIGEFARS